MNCSTHVEQARKIREPRSATGAMLIVVSIVASWCAARQSSAVDPSRSSSTSAAAFSDFAVAADHAIASEAGAEILRRGGNAIDAAAAVSFTLSVVRPESCGIGGGGFMLIHLRNDPRFGTLTTAINYREQCPAAITREFYTRPENSAPRDSDASTRGGKAVGIPGTVAGLAYAVEKYGTLDLATILGPAIRAAESGFDADEHYVRSVNDAREWFDKEPDVRRVRLSAAWESFLNRGRVGVGDRIRVQRKAVALRLLAEHGPGAFYHGEIADAIVAAVRADGGVLTKADLASFRVEEVKPLTIEFAGATIHTMPPPSSGGLAIAQILGVLGRRDESLPEIGHNSARYVHLVAEASKHAFADRARWLGDPAFVPIPIDRLLSDEYLRTRAELIDPDHTLSDESYGSVPPGDDDGGTSHFCVVDARGSAVACTETINLEFGSLLVVPEFGFLLNDQMDDFLTRPGEPNAFGLTQSTRNLPEPGKRPLSSMAPTIAVDPRNAEVRVIAGASGGPRIISATLQSVLNVLVFDMDAGAALRAERFHHQWMPGVLRLEPELHRLVNEHMRQRGHAVKSGDPIAAAQLIRRSRDGTGWDAACDPRKGGRPAGR